MQRDADEVILEGRRRCRNEEVIEESRTAVDALRQPSDGDRLIDAAAVRDGEVGSKERAVASGDGAGRSKGARSGMATRGKSGAPLGARQGR